MQMQHPDSSNPPDLNLPVPEAPLPRYHDLPLSSVYARNAVVMRETVYDDAYFARRLARMITEPFVME